VRQINGQRCKCTSNPPLPLIAISGSFSEHLLVITDPHFKDKETGFMLDQSPFQRGCAANIRMFCHLTPDAKAESLACDEPKPADMMHAQYGAFLA